MTTKDLKNALLYEAVQDKLVSQIANDLLEEIRKGQTKPLSEITEEDIPENWCLCRLDNISEIARGDSLRSIKDCLTKDKNVYNWIKIGDEEKEGKYINHAAEKIKKEGLKKTMLVHKKGLLLTSSVSFGRPYVLNIDGSILGKFFFCYILSFFYAYNQFCDSVSVVNNLNTYKVRESIFPLPSFAEQKRIVTVMEKLLPLCEKLGE